MWTPVKPSERAERSAGAGRTPGDGRGAGARSAGEWRVGGGSTSRPWTDARAVSSEDVHCTAAATADVRARVCSPRGGVPGRGRDGALGADGALPPAATGLSSRAGRRADGPWAGRDSGPGDSKTKSAGGTREATTSGAGGASGSSASSAVRVDVAGRVGSIGASSTGKRGSSCGARARSIAAVFAAATGGAPAAPRYVVSPAAARYVGSSIGAGWSARTSRRGGTSPGSAGTARRASPPRYDRRLIAPPPARAARPRRSACAAPPASRGCRLPSSA